MPEKSARERAADAYAELIEMEYIVPGLADLLELTLTQERRRAPGTVHERRRSGPKPRGIDEKQLSARLTPRLRERLEAERALGQSLSALVRCLLAEALDARDRGRRG